MPAESGTYEMGPVKCLGSVPPSVSSPSSPEAPPTLASRPNHSGLANARDMTLTRRLDVALNRCLPTLEIQRGGGRGTRRVRATQRQLALFA